MRKILYRPEGAKSLALYEFRAEDKNPTLKDLEPGKFYDISEEGSGLWFTKKADEKGEIGLLLFPEGFAVTKPRDS